MLRRALVVIAAATVAGGFAVTTPALAGATTAPATARHVSAQPNGLMPPIPCDLNDVIESVYTHQWMGVETLYSGDYRYEVRSGVPLTNTAVRFNMCVYTTSPLTVQWWYTDSGGDMVPYGYSGAPHGIVLAKGDPRYLNRSFLWTPVCSSAVPGTYAFRNVASGLYLSVNTGGVGTPAHWALFATAHSVTVNASFYNPGDGIGYGSGGNTDGTGVAC